MSTERMSEVKRRLTPEAAERIRWRANQRMLRGVQFLRDDPDNPDECPIVTLTAFTAVRLGSHFPWEMAEGNA